MMPSWLGMTARRHSGTSHTARVERTDPKANTSPEDALQQVYSREPRRDRTEGYRKPRTMRRSELEVAERIGKGAYGGVWKAKLLADESDVVVKVVFPDPDLDPEEAAKAGPSRERLESFQREIDVMSKLGEHPNVMSILGITADWRVLVLEEAMTDLHQMIKCKRRSLTISMARLWSRDILNGVAYLHSIDVIHRDLKPANLLIFSNMCLKIGDFGLARLAAPTDSLTVRREVCTVWYRAPELIMGSSCYNSLIDVWSAGAIILEMLVGRCVIDGKIEAICKCKKVTHYNFNHDQLAKIFRLVGTPDDSALMASMDCLGHFQEWQPFPPRLDAIVRAACTPDRLPAHERRMVQLLGARWSDCLRDMLQVDPRLRKHARAVLQSSLFFDGDSHHVTRVRIRRDHIEPDDRLWKSRIEEFGGYAEIANCEVASDKLRKEALQQHHAKQQQQQEEEASSRQEAAREAGRREQDIALAPGRGGMGKRVTAPRAIPNRYPIVPMSETQQAGVERVQI